VRDGYDRRDPDCVFCQAEISPRVLAGEELAFVIEDMFPVAEGHRLVIPRRHVADYFELHQSERNALDRLLLGQRDAAKAEDPSVSGFNVGVNIGEDAGQTVFHVHLHLIPRRHGDTEDPRGGVRGVIPGKRKY